MKKLLTSTFFFFALLANAKNYTLSGTIKDANNGETLIGATIRSIEDPTSGALANEYGFYSLSIPEGKHTIIIQSMGYCSDSLHINLNNNIERDIKLETQCKVLNDVVISAEKSNSNITNPLSGVQKLDMKELNQLPVLFGEKDIVKSVQLLPGVKSNGDGGGNFYVRGGAGDQNQILLDEANVYNASHLMGFFSTFNSDAIKDVSLYKGTQPAQYGGRLSSAMDIRMKEGNKQSYETAGSLGLISSKLAVEGPIVKDKGSFLITGRRTYADMFLALSDEYKGNQLYFYDLNLKANYQLTKKDAVYLSGYFGRDKMAAGDLFGIDWGNATGTVRWNHILNSKLFSNTSFILSNYNYNININFGGADFDVKSSIDDINLKQEFQYFSSNKNTIKAGLSSIYHTILPGEVSGDNIVPKKLQNQYSWENAVYVSDEWKAAKWFTLNAGVRISSFTVLGSGDFYTLNDASEVTDTVHYGSNEVVKNYINPEPRLNTTFILNDASSIKASYSRNTQYLHLISNSTTSSPTDKWMSTDNNVKPGKADLYSVGYFQNFNKDMFESSIEVYYKDMYNQVDYKDGADIFFNDQIATQLLEGVGRAYGVEFYLKKQTGKLTGWISYTLSRTEKKIDGINNSDWYAARQDKTHDIAIVLAYQISPKVNIAANWVYSTGNAVTFPSGKYIVDNQTVWLYTERNGYRMPDYHRLDLGVNFNLKETKNYSSELSIGLYNAYGRENAYSITFRDNEDDPTRTEAVQTALFRFVPSISWNFKFK